MPRWNNPNCGFQKGHKVLNTGATYFKKGNPIRPPYPPRVKKSCLVCKKIYFVIPSRSLKTKCCSRKCGYVYHDPKKFITKDSYKKASKSNSGINHWNWKGGVTPLIIQKNNKNDWKILREKVYERDGRKCRICGASDKRLNAHHINPWRLSKDDSLKNLITVCCHCHGKLEHGKIIWEK
jgi:hypothetical protein